MLANVCYSHDMIMTAARMVQAKPEFANDSHIKGLQFKHPWIHGCLRKNAMRPRRITPQARELPSPQAVQERMALLQAQIVEGEYVDDEVYNGD